MDLLSFPDHSRIWIYAADKAVPEDLVSSVNDQVFLYAKNWSSHQMAVKATGGLLHGYFIVFIVDETGNKPGGCSIDGSVQFVRNLGQSLGIDFLNRQYLYYLADNELSSIPLNELQSAFETGKINLETLFFDTLVADKLSFQKSWLKPLKDSWQRRFVDSIKLKAES